MPRLLPAKGQRLPALLCLALTAGLAVQLAAPPATELSTVPFRRPARLTVPAAPAIPDYPTLLAYSLFSPDRQAGGAGATSDQAPAVLGVARDRRTASAVVQGSGGAIGVLRPGETFQGWRLVAVSSATAVFTGPAGRVAVRVGVPHAPPPSSPAATTSQEAES